MIQKNLQRTLADQLFHPEKQNTKTAAFLAKMESVIDWNPLVKIVSSLNKSGTKKGGRPRHHPMLMVKALFLQHFYGLSDPQLQEQLNDRLSFQHFVGLSLGNKAPDFTSFWKFKDELVQAGLSDQLFEEVNRQLDEKGLFVRKGTIVDATMVESTNRPMKKEKLNSEKVQNNPQLDSEARSGKKGNRYYFGYKGHIGLDMESKLINKRVFSPANEHDSNFTEKLADLKAKALLGDKGYADDRIKIMARQFGWYYGILDKAYRNRPLSSTQHKRNRKLGRIRAVVEHPFAWMKTQAKALKASARSQAKNALIFDFSCMCWNLKQANLLLAAVP